MSITASKARKEFFRLIKEVNEDHDAIEIVSKHGNAVLVSAEDYATFTDLTYARAALLPWISAAP
jgi:antitoxin YefM